MASLLRSAAARHLRLAQPRRLAAAAAPPSRYLLREDVARHDPPVNWGFTIVPERKVFVIERFGKFLKTLAPGIHLLVPGADQVAYVHSLKEVVVPIVDQSAITRDKVAVGVRGAMYLKVVNPYLASYAVEDPLAAAIELAAALLIEELGQITYDKTPGMKKELSGMILTSFNKSAQEWGLTCCQCDIRDVFPLAQPTEVTLFDLLVGHGSLLDLIYEEVKKSADGMKAVESLFRKSTEASAQELKRSRRWTILLSSLLHVFVIAMGSVASYAILYGYLYPEEALDLQDKIIERYVSSARISLFGGKIGGETLVNRYRREAQEKADAEKKKQQEEEEASKRKQQEEEEASKRKQQEEAEELLRRKLEKMTMLRWILYRLHAGRRRD
ncbi:unnamed protein product [Urochloa humidicola]